MSYKIVTDDKVEKVLVPLMKNEDAFMEPARMLDGHNPPEMDNVFYDENRRGCYISIKVPGNPQERGRALHFNVRCMVDPSQDQSFQIWPQYNAGAGHFHSKGIRRSSGWRDRLRKAASTGLDYCWNKYGKMGCKRISR